MAVQCSDSETSVEVSSLVDSAFDDCMSVTGSSSLCPDHSQGRSTVLCPNMNVGIDSVSEPACQVAPAWYIVN